MQRPIEDLKELISKKALNWRTTRTKTKYQQRELRGAAEEEPNSHELGAIGRVESSELLLEDLRVLNKILVLCRRRRVNPLTSGRRGWETTIWALRDELA